MSGEGSRRIRFAGIELEELDAGRCRAKVEMEWRGARFAGTAEEPASELRDARCAGRAASEALRHLAEPAGAAFDILDLETVKVLNANAVVVAIAARTGAVTRYAVGFCIIRDDPAGAAVRAVLNGTNRFLSQVLDTETA
jgi:hypothetical protein